MFRYLFLLLTFSWFLFPFYLNVLPEIVWALSYNIIIIGYLLLNYKLILSFLANLYPYRNYVISFMFCYFCTMFYAIVIVLFNGSNDYSYIYYLLKILRVILCYVFLLTLTYNLLKSKMLFREFFIMYIIACCMYILVTTLLIFCPELKLFWQDHLYTSKLNLELSELSFHITRYGWVGFSGFLQTYMCSIGVILLLFLTDHDKKSHMTALVILLIGNLYYGRSGAILSLICIFVNFVMLFKLQKFAMLAKLIVCILLISFSIYSAKDSLPEIDLWLSWALNPFESMIDSLDSGTISVGNSGDHMFKDMYFIPEDKTILFGDGKYTNSDDSYYQHTDVGVMRSMLFYGIIGQSLGYLNLTILLFVLYKIFRKNKNKSGILMVYMLFIHFVFFELKGDPYYYLFGIVTASILAFSHDYKIDILKER